MFQFLNDHCVEGWDNLILSDGIFDFVLRIDVRKNTYVLEYIKEDLPYSLKKEGQYGDFLHYLQNMLYSNTEGFSVENFFSEEFSEAMRLIRIIGALSVHNSYSVLCKLKMEEHIYYKRMLFYYDRDTGAGKGNDSKTHIQEHNILAFCEDVTVVSDFVSRYEDVAAVSGFVPEYADKCVVPEYNEIRKQKEELKALQDNIIYLAHEIRTPVNSIYGNLCILKMEEYQNNKYLGNALFSAEYLLQLVNGILNINELKNNKNVRKIEAVTLEDLLKYPKGIFEQMAEDKNIELQFFCDKPVYRYLYLNREIIQQILINLISNAIKYTDGGGRVFCRISEEYLEEKRVKFLLEVADTGIGMEEDFLIKKFSSVRKDYTREYRKKNVAGSGLGLSITRRLVELLHGSLKIVSQVECGTNILVELEVDGDDVRYDTYCLSRREKKKANTGGYTLVKRVLVAEDEDANMEIICKYLDKLGIEADKSYSGNEVVEIFARSIENYYDMILMDINMPDKGGIEAIRTIRGLDRKDKNLPVIAVTADTIDKQKMNDVSVKINGYITKPYRLEDIISALSKYQR